MNLINLPAELLELIITETLPEGFEALTLSCKLLYVLSTPFIARHNQLSSQFNNFIFLNKSLDIEHDIWTAFDLVVKIADEPIVARYIKYANFENDSMQTRYRRRRRPSFHTDIEDVEYGGKFRALLAESEYLKQAGIEAEDFWSEIQQELTGRDHVYDLYSQHAAAFLLTLLPNVEDLHLPRMWRPDDSTYRLMEVIAKRARQHKPLCHNSSLAAVCRYSGETSRANLGWVFSLLSLPRLRSFEVTGSVSVGSATPPWYNSGQYLTAVNFRSCDIDHVAIAKFLKCTPNLILLIYSHRTAGKMAGTRAWRGPQHAVPEPRDWDISRFVTAIEHERGQALKQLLISIVELRGTTVPGRASLRRLQQLRLLRLPLELVECNLDAAVQVQNDGNTDQRSLMQDLVPPRVSTISICLPTTKNYGPTLETFVSIISDSKELGLYPTLKEICLQTKANDAVNDDVYHRIRIATDRADISLHTGRKADERFSAALKGSG